jgi:hypothetical protein
MKRGSPMRRTGFTPAQRATRLTRTAKASKRAKVSPEERSARKTVALRSQGVCEGCGERPAHDWAHRVGRGQQGRWCASNGLHLCNPGGCHDRAHASPLWARERGWILLSTQDPEREPALLAGRGWVYLRPDGSVAEAERGAA